MGKIDRKIVVKWYCGCEQKGATSLLLPFFLGKRAAGFGCLLVLYSV
nr:MAG TPA: centrosome-associated protein [Caudoviricetes sp.]